MDREKMTTSPFVIAIVGPTASGKTALSVDLSKRIGGEIINGDAMQVYKGLNIGTAKITEEEKQGVPHYLFDIKEATEAFSVAEYQENVRSAIDAIHVKGKIPIIVGGTGLYIQSVLYDFRFTEQASDEEVRLKLERQLIENGPEALYEKLQEADPKSAEKIHPNNHRRLIRALEIIEVTGKTKNAHEDGKGQIPIYEHFIVGLDLERALLYERIDRRVDAMMEKGLLEEAKGLWDAGVRNVQSVKAIGYKELHQYFEGTLTIDEAVALIKKNTRNYAKRQMTYFRNKLDVHWFDALTDREIIINGILSILKDFDQNISNNR